MAEILNADLPTKSICLAERMSQPPESVEPGLRKTWHLRGERGLWRLWGNIRIGRRQFYRLIETIERLSVRQESVQNKENAKEILKDIRWSASKLVFGMTREPDWVFDSSIGKLCDRGQMDDTSYETRVMNTLTKAFEGAPQKVLADAEKSNEESVLCDHAFFYTAVCAAVSYFLEHCHF
jgi:hypothetical protein